MEKIAESEDLPLKKSSLQKIFGSNLALHSSFLCIANAGGN
jgi:hypothetical protein